MDNFQMRNSLILYKIDTILHKNVGFVDESGPVWREQRRSALHILRDLGFGKRSLEDRILDEITYLTDRIDQSDGQPFDIHSVLTPSMSNNICHLVFGHRLEFNDRKRVLLDNLLDSASTRFSQIGVLSLAPIWFSRIVLRIGAYGNRRLFQTIFSIFK